MSDNFEDAARAEAERRHPAPEIETGDELGYTRTQIREVVRRAHVEGWKAARDHLAEQEQTERGALAEVLGRWATGPALAQMVVAEVRGALAQEETEQEPSDAEVEAAKQAADDHSIVVRYYRNGEIRWEGCSACDLEIADYDEQERHTAREALRAAARIGKEQER